MINRKANFGWWAMAAVVLAALGLGLGSVGAEEKNAQDTDEAASDQVAKDATTPDAKSGGGGGEGGGAALVETLSGATLVGSFTVTGQENDGDLREERYTIRSVEQLQENLFLFRVRIQYGERDATVAVPLVVIWSGDTPVITLTNAAIPGMGRYTARVMIYRDHYAGYWSAGEVEGNMFGTIEREAE
ncbi:MAG: hypothetical protein WD294_07110 [Phycisphaeraceae bacterium]